MEETTSKRSFKMNDDQILAIITAIIGHDEFKTRREVATIENVIRGHVDTARAILEEASKRWRPTPS